MKVVLLDFSQLGTFSYLKIKYNSTAATRTSVVGETLAPRNLVSKRKSTVYMFRVV